VSKRVWTVAEVRQLGVATDVETAGSVLGIGRTTAYALARADAFPVPVLRVGGATSSRSRAWWLPSAPTVGNRHR